MRNAIIPLAVLAGIALSGCAGRYYGDDRYYRDRYYERDRYDRDDRYSRYDDH